jgi:hypothetical protein
MSEEMLAHTDEVPEEADGELIDFMMQHYRDQ